MYKKLCSIFIIISVLVTLSDSKKFRFDYEYHKDIDGWIKLHRVPSAWHDAWLRCQLEGAVLASPINTPMDTAMRRIMRYHDDTKDGIFTGIHATFSKGDFFSVEGVPISRMPVSWMPYEPNNKNNDEDCILYAANGTIADVSCDRVLSYACYKKNDRKMVVTECGTVDKGYILDTRTRSCYKFHRVARNWTRAFMTCAAEGGYLAIINSELEAKILKDLFAKYPVSSLRSNLQGVMKDLIHIGFNDWRQRGIWTTIHGTPLAEAGYDIFPKGQPDNAPPGEYCGAMWRNGGLDDVWCHKRGAFVCEKDPDSLVAEIDDDDNLYK